MNNLKKTIFFSDTIYSLLIYLLLKSKKEINETVFIISSRIPEAIKLKLPNVISYTYPTSHLDRLKGSFFIRKTVSKLHKEGYTDVFGNDNLHFAPFFIEKFNFHVLEDGLMNYNRELYKYYTNLYPTFSLIQKIFWRISNGKWYLPLGLNEKTKSVVLTGLTTIPDKIKSKVHLVELKELWRQSDYKKNIISIFNLNDIISEGDSKPMSLLITQCFSEDGIFSEKEKIDIYKQIVDKNPSIIIKPHPRETTDYSKLFTKSQILPSYFPIELLELVGIKFNNVITLYSSSALSFKNSNIIWYGNLCTPSLNKYFNGKEIKQPNAYLKE